MKRICKLCGRVMLNRFPMQNYHANCQWKVTRARSIASGRARIQANQYKWKRQVLELNRICAYCGSSKKLEADHIRSFGQYPHLRSDVSNGQALCKECHKLKTYLDRIEARFNKNLVPIL